MFPKKEIFEINRLEGSKKCYVEEVTLTEERKRQINKFKRIEFGDKFNDSIDFLSDNVTYISLGTNFEQPINRLPANLTVFKISIYSHFNFPLEYLLPDSLKILQLNEYYDNDIIIPSQLVKITFSQNYNLEEDELFEVNNNMFISRYFYNTEHDYREYD
jgi:hypothetical protein